MKLFCLQILLATFCFADRSPGCATITKTGPLGNQVVITNTCLLNSKITFLNVPPADPRNCDMSRAYLGEPCFMNDTVVGLCILNGENDTNCTPVPITQAEYHWILDIPFQR
jgi:hypothetical protein